jgi:hypothetical protein
LFENRAGHRHDLNHRPNIVDTNDRRAVSDEGRPTRGAEEPLRRLGLAGDPADKTLAAGADNHRPPEGEELALAAEQLEVVLLRLAEADARVEQDFASSTPTAWAAATRSRRNCVVSATTSR